MNIKTLDQMDVKGKRLLIRVDYNVPLSGETITDDNRIRQSLPTLQYCLDNGASLVLCSHLGNPKIERDPALSLKPVAKRLEELLGKPVQMAPDCVGPEVKAMADALKPGEVLLLENLRYHPGEKKDDDEFGRALASLGDIYVNDAFGTAHRANASISAVTKHVQQCCAGLLMKKELVYLGDALKEPKRPFVGVFGGAKVSSKLAILNSLVNKVDALIIGGAMANTFLKALGYRVGTSLVEDDLLQDAMGVLKAAREKGVKVYLPVDFILGESVKDEKPMGTAAFQDVPDDRMILDIGPATRVLFAVVLANAQTVVWNGPMGAFENPAFVRGSESLAETLANSKALTIVGGGDTDAVLHQAKLADKFDFISTGGGSFMEFMEGKELPAIKALEECAAR